jgi:hypothetical protein
LRHPAVAVFDALRRGRWIDQGAFEGDAWRDGEASGRVLKEDAPRSLTLSHTRSGAETKVFLVLVQGPDGTTLEVLHTHFDSSEARDLEVPVWRVRLERLEAALR